jgi:BirA family transcriptional regulator, biotin operon repressor / biotin---[acetyl-CoA-carboxylase] ligase
MNIFDKKKFHYFCKTENLGKKIFCFESISSTNDHAGMLEERALRLNRKDIFFNKLNGTVIISETQNSGHGRNYKKWYSPEGGLWFTLILFSRIKASDVEKINIIMAVSIQEAVKSMLGLDMKIKWPNDIYFKDKKICGILSELNNSSEWSFLNIGVGLNVNNDFSKTSSGNVPDLVFAASLREIIKEKIDREKLLANIIRCFEINYENYNEKGDLKNIFKKIDGLISI